jgi:hypothetical protein
MPGVAGVASHGNSINDSNEFERKRQQRVLPQCWLNLVRWTAATQLKVHFATSSNYNNHGNNIAHS